MVEYTSLDLSSLLKAVEEMCPQTEEETLPLQEPGRKTQIQRKPMHRMPQALAFTIVATLI